MTDSDTKLYFTKRGGDGGFARQRFNPVEYIAEMVKRYKADIDVDSFMRFDPSLVPQYKIVRSQTHDGTMMFTQELLDEAMARLANRVSYYKPMGSPESSGDVRYVVGWAKFATVFGMVDLKCGRYPGLRERITIPVRCVYVRAVDAGWMNRY